MFVSKQEWGYEKLIEKEVLDSLRKTDMITFLEQRCGFTFKKIGDGYRCEQRESLAVKDNHLSWYWHSQKIGGYGAIDYLMKIENMEFREAIEVLRGVSVKVPIIPNPTPPQEKKPKILELPEKSSIPLNVYNYLCGKRKINRQLVSSLLDSGQLYEDKRRNCIFVGFDEHKKPKFASMRGTGTTDFRMDCTGSDKRYGFFMKGTELNRVFVFETPIDALSHASIVGYWGKDLISYNRLCLGGLSDLALEQFLKDNPGIRKIILCLDNDIDGKLPDGTPHNHGQEAAKVIKAKYELEGYAVQVDPPKMGKDFNEDLISLCEIVSDNKVERQVSCL